MKIKNFEKFLKYIIPISLSTFFILFFMKKNNIDYVSVEMDIPSEMENQRINEKSSSIKKFPVHSREGCEKIQCAASEIISGFRDVFIICSPPTIC